MFQHMAALNLIAQIPQSRLSGISLPEWGIDEPDIRKKTEREFTVHRDTHMRVPFEAIARAIDADACDSIIVRNYVQHMDNFLPPSVYRKIYVDTDPQTDAVAADELLINVRGEEILGGGAPDYVLIPANYYKRIVEETGLRPVLMGQLTSSAYLDALREALPHARLLPSQGMMKDFSIIRHAANIVACISTFSWLAAWLSNAQRIFLPLAGTFHPFQRPDIDLVPLDDPRYRFDLFPSYFALPPQAAIEQHAAMDGMWRRLAPDHLRAFRDSRPRIRFDLAKFEPVFDEDYYCQQEWDVGAAKRAGIVPSGFEHYLRVGHKEGRPPFQVDRAWYCSAYPLAAFEIGQGDFLNCHHHYVEVGRQRGYLPVKPAA